METKCCMLFCIYSWTTIQKNNHRKTIHRKVRSKWQLTNSDWLFCYFPQFSPFSISAALCPSHHQCTHFISSFKSNITHNIQFALCFLFFPVDCSGNGDIDSGVRSDSVQAIVLSGTIERSGGVIYGITYSVEGVGKSRPLKAKSLNTMSHIHRHQLTQTHIHGYTHRYTHRQWIRMGIMEA